MELSKCIQPVVFYFFKYNNFLTVSLLCVDCVYLFNTSQPDVSTDLDWQYMYTVRYVNDKKGFCKSGEPKVITDDFGCCCITNPRKIIEISLAFKLKTAK